MKFVSFKVFIEASHESALVKGAFEHQWVRH